MCMSWYSTYVLDFESAVLHQLLRSFWWRLLLPRFFYLRFGLNEIQWNSSFVSLRQVNNVYTFGKSLFVIRWGPHMVYMGSPYIFYIYMIKCGWLGYVQPMYCLCTAYAHLMYSLCTAYVKLMYCLCKALFYFFLFFFYVSALYMSLQ